VTTGLGALALTGRERDLLVAATAGADVAAAAWQRWRAGGSIEQSGLSEQELFPAVFANLPPEALAPSDEAILRGLFRRSWYLHHRLAAVAHSSAAALRAAGIESLLLKGVALAWSRYPAVAARPVSDLDVLVSVRTFERAVDVLLGEGWRLSIERDAPPWLQAVALVDDNGQELDLHRWVFAHRFGGADDGLWERSIPVEVAGSSMRRLTDEDQLVLTLLHGLLGGERNRLRWFVDVHHLVAGAPSWDAVLARARPARIAVRIEAGLRATRQLLGTPVPDAVLEQLSAVPVPRGTRLVWALERRARPAPVDLSLRAYLGYEVYRSAIRAAGRRPSVLGYIRMRYRDLRRQRRLPWAARQAPAVARR